MKRLKKKVTVHNHRRQNDGGINRESHLPEKKCRGPRAEGWTEVQAEMYRENKQHLFPIETEGFNVTVLDQRQESLSLCSLLLLFVLFFCHPQKGRCQGRGSRRVKGQSPRVGDTHTHTHTKTLDQYYKPQHQECVKSCTSAILQS